MLQRDCCGGGGPLATLVTSPTLAKPRFSNRATVMGNYCAHIYVHQHLFSPDLCLVGQMGHLSTQRGFKGIKEINNLSFLCLRVEISLHFSTDCSEGAPRGKTLSVGDGKEVLLPVHLGQRWERASPCQCELRRLQAAVTS